MTVPATGRVVCAGGAVVDRLLHLNAPAVPGTSNPARACSGSGGVARNVAENLARLGVDVALVSCVGDDPAGAGLLAHARDAGVGTAGVRAVPGATTAEYVAVLDPDGDLVLGVSAADVLGQVTAADLTAELDRGPAAWVLLDCNLGADVLADCLAAARAAGSRVAVEAVSTAKVTRLPARLDGLDVLFCNRDEARALAASRGTDGGIDGGIAVGIDGGDDADRGRAAAIRALGAAATVLTRGPDPVLVAGPDGVTAVDVAAGAAGAPGIVDVTGAGDAFVGGALAGLARGAGLAEACRLGVRVALLTVGSEHSVRPDLSPEVLRP